MAPAETHVLKWKDGKQAVFLLAFDDSCGSHVKNVIPELKKRGIPGTFYVVPGGGPFKSHQKAWETEIPAPGLIEYGNHTFTHVGATNTTQLDEQLRQCAEAIDRCYPGRKQPRLVSFGRPGGVPWTVTDDEKKQALAKYNLIERPSFAGPPFTCKTVSNMQAYVEATIAKGEMGHLDFHGVGGDWLVTSMDYFTALLDKLDACRDKLWLTDAISWHKYQTERVGAKVEVSESSADRIRLRLTSAADARLYDQPLTLSTRVPPAWKTCRVEQGTISTNAAVADGLVRYDALPGADEIRLTPAP